MVNHRARRRVNNRASRPRRPRNPRNSGSEQRVASLRDVVHRARGMKIIVKKEFNNADSAYAYSINNVSLSTTTSPTLSSYLEGISQQFRQYRMSRVRVYATLGQGMTNDDRISVMFASRVNVLNVSVGANASNLRSLLSAANTKILTMVNTSNLKLVDVRPINWCNYASSGFGQTANPLLPSQFQWYSLAQRTQHYWKVANIAQFLPQPSLSPGTKSINYWYEVDFEFRDRISAPVVYDSIGEVPIDEDQDQPSPETYDLIESQIDLRDHLLTGAYVPTSADFPSIGNIGSTITEAEIIDHTFRDEATTINYIIKMYADGDVGADIVDAE